LRRALSDHQAQRAKEVTLLKLHGSIDWLLGGQREKHHPIDDYRSLTTLSHRSEFNGTENLSDAKYEKRLLRTTWNINNAWLRIKSRSSSPHIATMGNGKSEELIPLDPIWRDAYTALSSAKELNIIGYSMPADDLEIRTLLRAGTSRGKQKCNVSVKNPSPEVHDRIRRLIAQNIKSDYSAVTT
jgi:hypothetical protein